MLAEDRQWPCLTRLESSLITKVCCIAFFRIEFRSKFTMHKHCAWRRRSFGSDVHCAGLVNHIGSAVWAAQSGRFVYPYFQVLTHLFLCSSASHAHPGNLWRLWPLSHFSQCGQQRPVRIPMSKWLDWPWSFQAVLRNGTMRLLRRLLHPNAGHGEQRYHCFICGLSTY